MKIEVQYLAFSAVLGLLHLIASSHAISHQYGYRWTASNRDEPMPPLKALPGRIDRAGANFLETFPIFAAVLLAALIVGKTGELTSWGVRLYFWGRVAHAIFSIAGLGLLRSLIWNVALAGIVLVIIALFWL